MMVDHPGREQPRASRQRVSERANSVIAMAGRIVAGLFVAQWVFFQLMLRNWDRVEVAARFFLGNDFAYLYNAAGYYLSGASPYKETSFIPLPPALYLPMALHHLSFWNAFIAFRVVTFVLVVVAIVWLSRQLKLNLLNTALILAITLTYAPFYALLTGGNLDGLMMAFLVFACARSVAASGSFLGLSIGTKFYSILLVPVLIVRRQWRELLWAIAVLCVLLLPFISYIPDAFASVFHRTSVLRLSGNESPAVLFIVLFGEKRIWAWRSCYVALWGGTLLIRLLADWVTAPSCDIDKERFRTLDYLPWMAGAPVLVFTYTGTILLPVMARLLRNNQERRLFGSERIIVSGFLLTGIYPFVASEILTGVAPLLHLHQGATEALMNCIAPLGISAILIGSGLQAWRTFRASGRPGSILQRRASEPNIAI